MGLTIRAFVALLVAALPPLVVLLALDLANPGLREGTTFNLMALGILAAAVGWVAVMAILVSRILGEELRELVRLTERGSRAPGADAERVELDARSRRVAETLDERNRQVAQLASQANAAPISDDPRLVAAHVVRTVRSVTGDPTWILAVLDTDERDALPPGVYDEADAAASAAGPPAPDELHRWAAAAGSETGARVRRAEGPWGAFVIVEVASHDALRAILLAPWEGRADPSVAEADLLSLVGQHAATAIEHALLYARVRRQAQELDRLGAIQRDFLRAVSHDLQTPLASIRALAGELRTRIGDDASAADDLDTIEFQADRLRRMVQQLLAMSRLEAGVLEPSQEVLSARPLVERTWNALRAGDRPLELTVSGQPMLLVADPDRLEQVLWAVLDNAVKYSPDGTAVAVRIGPADGTADRAAISISDDGPGMDPETARRAFEQFYRSADAKRLAPDGTGIGLYTARGLVEAMGGRVQVETALGRGTTITLELPAEPVEETAGAAPQG